MIQAVCRLPFYLFIYHDFKIDRKKSQSASITYMYQKIYISTEIMNEIKALNCLFSRITNCIIKKSKMKHKKKNVDHIYDRKSNK